MTNFTCDGKTRCDSYNRMASDYEADLNKIEKLEGELNQLANQYNSIVNQNRSLQKELNEIKKKPFFPYTMNDGGRIDFGEFVLISHAWFTISNLPFILGIVEIECLPTGTRKMYLGYGSSDGKDFKKDVLDIVLHGQKIHDSYEGF